MREAIIYPLSEGIVVETWSQHPPVRKHNTCPLVYTLDGEKAKESGLHLLTGMRVYYCCIVLY
jgi:hypothetical protein